MAEAAPTRLKPSECIEWMWQSNPNPWSKTEPAEWSHYSDVENLIIEEGYSSNQPKAQFDHYYIDFKHSVQIFNDDHNKQRRIKRVVCNKEDKHLREERFMVAPITAKRSVGGEYGWVSPFIIEVRRDLKLKPAQLPSKNKKLIPELVEKAAWGIIEEGKQVGRQCEAEKMAKLLRATKDKEFEEVWKCCAHLYSLESFLYKNLNAAMRLIGDKEHEDSWRGKIRTLGPFCLLLWDDPINKKVKMNTTLYRGANLKPEDIAMYEEMTKQPEEFRSFQAFTSCSRNRAKAEVFGNTLFIIKVSFAFMADISSLSQYKEEEEELVAPGVCFRILDVEFDSKTNKHLITLELRQRWSKKNKEELQPANASNSRIDAYDRRGLRLGDFLRLGGSFSGAGLLLGPYGLGGLLGLGGPFSGGGGAGLLLGPYGLGGLSLDSRLLGLGDSSRLGSSSYYDRDGNRVGSN